MIRPLEARQLAAAMYLTNDFPGGGSGGDSDPWCRSCKQPIKEGQQLVQVHFPHDPNGVKELTGPYHAACSKPFDSLARAMTMLSRFGH